MKVKLICKTFNDNGYFRSKEKNINIGFISIEPKAKGIYLTI